MNDVNAPKNKGTALELTGQRFGRWTVIKRVENRKRKTYWLCRCDCGKESVVKGGNLTNGLSRSCGCYRSDVATKMHYVHGQAIRHNEGRLYNVWRAMKRRCNSPNDKRYSYYGGRGIKVCDEWNDYKNFEKWAMANGYDENAQFGDCTIDRIDNDGNYEPSNCRWVNGTTQANNTRKNRYVEFQGKRLTIAEFARAMNIDNNHAWYYVDKFDREKKDG